MATRYFGQPIKRNEDPRLLTGQATFTDDVHIAGMLHAAFVRSDYAHARIKRVDVSAALTMPGVVAIYTAADLGDYWQPGPLLVPPPPVKDLVFNPRTQVPLAKDKIRHSGEADRRRRGRKPLPGRGRRRTGLCRGRDAAGRGRYRARPRPWRAARPRRPVRTTSTPT